MNNILELARATTAKEQVRLNIDGDIKEFIRFFNRDTDGDYEIVHGEFVYYRDSRMPEDTYIPKLPMLSPHLVEREGWTVPKELWYQIPGRYVYEKGNYGLVLDVRKTEPHIEIIAKDVLLVEFMERAPERFSVTIPCPDIAAFRYIMKLLKID